MIAVLKEAGIPVFDCDEINAQLLRPKEAGHAALLERYGSRFIDAKGEIDRQALSDHMFETAEGRREVEAILHPLIKQRLPGRDGALRQRDRRGGGAAAV